MPSVLLVEDSVEMRRMIRSIIADLADPIVECVDGADALAAYDAHRPDWVLMDIEMPRMDGITATRRILAAFPDAQVMIVTQHRDVRLVEAARQAGALEYVLKENLLDLRSRLQSQ